jgi:hypothetical protein
MGLGLPTDRHSLGGVIDKETQHNLDKLGIYKQAVDNACNLAADCRRKYYIKLSMIFRDSAQSPAGRTPTIHRQ